MATPMLTDGDTNGPGGASGSVAADRGDLRRMSCSCCGQEKPTAALVSRADIALSRDCLEWLLGQLGVTSTPTLPVVDMAEAVGFYEQAGFGVRVTYDRSERVNGHGRCRQSASRIALSLARSLRVARRTAGAINGASSLENPAGSPRFRMAMRVEFGSDGRPCVGGLHRERSLRSAHHEPHARVHLDELTGVLETSAEETRHARGLGASLDSRICLPPDGVDLDVPRWRVRWISGVRGDHRGWPVDDDLRGHVDAHAASSLEDQAAAPAAVASAGK